MKKRGITVKRDFLINIAAAFPFIAAVSMTVLIMITSAVLIISNRSIEGIIINQQMISETDAEILNTLLDLESKKNNGDIHLSASVLLEDSERTKVLTGQNISGLIKIKSRNAALIAVLIVSVIVHSVVFFYSALKRSRRISRGF